MLPRILFLIFLGALYLMPQSINAQVKQEQVALINHVKVRQQFVAFDATRRSKFAEWKLAQQAYLDSVLQLEGEAVAELKKDSIAGGKTAQQILRNKDARRKTLDANYNIRQSVLTASRIEAMKALELKISRSIIEVMNERKLSGLRIIQEDQAAESGFDITASVLEKLN